MKAKLEALGLLVTEIDDAHLLDCYGSLYLLKKATEMLDKDGYSDDRSFCRLLGVEPATETRFSRLMGGHNIKYETSEADNLIHFECLMDTHEEIEANIFLKGV